MSSEQRTIRPFAGLDAFQEIFNQFRLIVGTDRVEPDDAIRLTREGFVLRPVSLELSATDELFELSILGLGRRSAELGFQLSDLELVITASSPYLKIADIVTRHPLSRFSELERSVSLTSPTRPRALHALHSGCTIDAYLCLASDLPQLPLRPWRRGTWLAKVSFGITSESQPIGFSPRPLTEADRKRLDLPDGVLRFIDLGDVSPLDEGTNESSLDMWVDAEVLAKLSASSGSAPAKLFQLQLFLDAVLVILDGARLDPQLRVCTIEDLHGTLFGTLIEGLSRRPGQTVEQRKTAAQELLHVARDKPQLFIAHAEATIGLKKMMNEALDS